ncbi:GNAT family N-acetyltransferase [Kiloniella majae]|uniref:GNAT family N-acetyltransferase n=1 Tax=Kiloniella majae TaxID=1938558 RepID=UPI000A278BF4|nr:GNAT family N-acetyltransferase [Kiloniella majae]
MSNLSDSGLSARFSLTQDGWLSTVLGKQVYSLRLSDDGLEIGELEANLEAVDSFTSIKLPADDIPPSVMLQSIGFKQIDTALTFCSSKSIEEKITNVRIALPDDKERVAEVAGQVFTTSRFHLDPLISNSKADEIKYLWAENYFHGKRGDTMLIAEDHQNKIQGFCQVIFTPDNNAVIDLIGVSEETRGKGFGTQMISYLWQQKPFNKPLEKIIVGTQAANIKAVNFYENTGFRLIKAQNILHYSSSSQ